MSWLFFEQSNQAKTGDNEVQQSFLRIFKKYQLLLCNTETKNSQKRSFTSIREPIAPSSPVASPAKETVASIISRNSSSLKKITSSIEKISPRTEPSPVTAVYSAVRPNVKFADSLTTASSQSPLSPTNQRIEAAFRNRQEREAERLAKVRSLEAKSAKRSEHAAQMRRSLQTKREEANQKTATLQRSSPRTPTKAPAPLYPTPTALSANTASLITPLPPIPSDDEASTGGVKAARAPVNAWYATPEVRRRLQSQIEQNPELVFGSPRLGEIEEIFCKK